MTGQKQTGIYLRMLGSEAVAKQHHISSLQPSLGVAALAASQAADNHSKLHFPPPCPSLHLSFATMEPDTRKLGACGLLDNEALLSLSVRYAGNSDPSLYVFLAAFHATGRLMSIKRISNCNCDPRACCPIDSRRPRRTFETRTSSFQARS